MTEEPRNTVAEAELLIRAPVSETFQAFVRPEIITQFWLSSTTGPLEQGTTVRWTFMVEDVWVDTTVTTLDEPERIAITWSTGTTVDFRFTPFGDHATVVTVENAGFPGDPREIVSAALAATEGFTIVLCDLKVLLETGKSPNLVRDKADLIAAMADG